MHIASGLSATSVGKKIDLMCRAFAATEQHLGIQLDVQACLRGEGTHSFTYTESGDDSWVVVIDKKTGVRRVFAEVRPR